MCERGTTREVIIDGKSISIDSCIADEVEAINKRPLLETLGSCCGHGVYPSTIIVRFKSGRVAIEWYSGVIIERKKRFYQRDDRGLYFLPDIGERHGEKP